MISEKESSVVQDHDTLPYYTANPQASLGIYHDRGNDSRPVYALYHSFTPDPPGIFSPYTRRVMDSRVKDRTSRPKAPFNTSRAFSRQKDTPSRFIPTTLSRPLAHSAPHALHSLDAQKYPPLPTCLSSLTRQKNPLPPAFFLPLPHKSPFMIQQKQFLPKKRHKHGAQEQINAMHKTTKTAYVDRRWREMHGTKT
jgi:hypothetical protein